MGKLKSVFSFLKITLEMIKEEFDTMDRKFYRIGAGILGFLAMGIFYYFFLRKITPF